MEEKKHMPMKGREEEKQQDEEKDSHVTVMSAATLNIQVKTTLSQISQRSSSSLLLSLSSGSLAMNYELNSVAFTLIVYVNVLRIITAISHETSKA